MTTRTDAQLGIDIDVQTSKAGKKVKKFSKGGQKAFKSMEKASKQFSLAFKGAIALFAGQKVLGAFNSVTQAAIKQENAINALNTQLKLSGDFSEQTSKDMQDFASSLQAVSTQGDETTLELLALAKTFDTTDNGAKKLTLAATELAAATGKAPQEALKQLAKSYSGLSGELGENLSSVRDLTAEQLKAGAAIDLVLNRFGGAATGQVQTFGGAISQLSNTFGDFQEKIGDTVIKSPALIKAVQGLNNIFLFLQKTVEDSEIDFGEVLADGLSIAIKSAVQFGRVATRVFSVVVNAGLALAKLSNQIAIGFLEMGKSSQGLIVVQTIFDTLLELAGGFLTTLSVIGDFLNLDVTSLEEAAIGMAKLQMETEDLDVAKLNNMQDALEGNVEALDQMQVSVGELDQSMATLGDNVVKAFEEGSKGLKKTSADLAKGLDGPQTKAQAEKQGASFGESAIKNFKDNFDGLALGKSLATGLAAASKNGGKESGAAFGSQAVQTIGSSLAESVLPGFGGAIFDTLSNFSMMSDEEIEQFVEGFVEGAVKFVEVLASNIDNITIAIIKGLVKSIAPLTFALVDGLATGLAGVFQGLIDGFLAIFKTLYVELPKAIFDAISDGATAIFDAISDALSFDLGNFGLGGDKGLLGGSIIPGFLNQGGVVGVSGYTNGGSIQKVIGSGIGDTVPIMAEPGEVMIKKQAVPDFDSYVGEIAKQVAGNGGGDQVIQLEVSLGDEILESRILRINQNNGRVA